MSNYYFNNQPISTFLVYIGASYSPTNFIENGLDLPYQKANPTDNFKITNTSFNYYKGGIDIATLFQPPYIEYTSTGTYNYSGMPNWCKVFRCIIIGGGGYGYSNYTNGGGGGQFSYSVVNVVQGLPRNIKIIVGQGGSAGSGNSSFNDFMTIVFNGVTAVGNGQSGGTNGGGSLVQYGGYNSIANGGSSAGSTPGGGGNGNIGSATLSYNGQIGQEGNSPGYKYGGNNGFKNAGFTHAGIENLNYGKGGDGGDPGDDYSGYYNGNSGYVRIYFCVN